MTGRGSLILISFVLLLHCFDLPGDAATIHKREAVTSESPTCGYQACAPVQPGKLNIHLVAHTHDDVGWLKTVDQYYFGSRTRIQKAGVQYILDSVIQALLNRPERKFIYVETAFLWKWWLRQNEQIRAEVRKLINQGRLEIIGGAWSMNDEATTHYHSLVDQFTWGFRRLDDTFGKCARPRIGWQIDPFGHSREQASLFAQMGFDGMLFGRIDYQDKSQRLTDKTMEFVWKASPSLGERANLFTAAMFNTYSPPPGFCFDILCADDPIIDDPESPDYNVDERVELFLAYAQIQARSYRTNNIILTMGDDFNYQDAEMWFTNLDRLIRYVNERNGTTVNAFYSTPSCYLKALHDQHLSWPTKSDDFFPYASDPHAYWTGYFSSRPTVKFFERMGNNILQISKQLLVLTDVKNFDEELSHFREVMGVMQHHDAVTGTEKQHVANDYSRILSQNIYDAEKMISTALSKWNKEEEVNAEATASYKRHTCFQLNVSSCAYTEENAQFTIEVYNPMSRPISTFVRLPVKGNAYRVFDAQDHQNVVSQMVPIPEAIQNIPGRESAAVKELVFEAPLPALGYKTYIIEEVPSLNDPYLTEVADTSIGGELYDVSVDGNGRVNVRYKTEKNMNFVQSFGYYEGAEGDNRVFENRSSGAYIFRPKQTFYHNFTYNGSYKIYKGPVVEEIHLTVNDWVSQVVRVYQGQQHVEFDWLVGPIPVQDKIGKEVITQYTSALNSQGVFYTDSNGREMLERVRDHRPTWKLKVHEPISANYYPITSKISLKDTNTNLKLNVLTDRAQGGTSMKDGQLELMLHRRLLKDDAFGVAEALNETAFGEGLVVRGTHYVYGGNVNNLDAFVLKEKELALQLALRPWIAIQSGAAICAKCNSASTLKSGLKNPLPPNVHVLTLEPWKDDTVLLRLEHLFEVGESPQMSQPARVNIQDLFTSFTVVSMTETTLGANQLLEESNPLKWEAETNEVPHHTLIDTKTSKLEDSGFNVLLKPMEIRTFILKISRTA